MARSLSSLLDLIGLNSSRPGLAMGVFPAVATQSIEKDIGLERLACERGRQDLPAPDATALDDVENRIVERIAEVRRRGIETFNNEMQVYADRLGNVDIEGRISEIAVAVSNGTARLGKSLSIGGDHLYTYQRELAIMDAGLDDFRKQNRIQRSARHERSLVLGIGVLAVILVAEGILNGFFFSQSNQLGLIGGVVTAVVVAAVNIGFCFLFGRLSTGVNHRRLTRKTAGLLAFLAFLAYGAALNLLVGHFREAAGTGTWEEATRNAVAGFAAEPLGLFVFDSWILVLLGFLFSVAAFVDGTAWDDPYPGYGPIWRQWRRTAEGYTFVKAQLLEELEGIKDETLEEIMAAREDIAGAVSTYIQAREFRAALTLGLPIFLEQAERAAQTLLAKYRALNRKTRRSAPPPHFAEAFRFPASAADPQEEAGIPPAKVMAMTQRADEVLEERQRQFLAAFDQAVADYRRIASLVGGPTGAKAS